MKPDITIIIPTYNVENYIEKCLKSIEKQTYQNFEAWIIDDGSPDNSKEIAKKFVKKDSRFKLKQKENGGYGSVLEYGIKHIKSKYFLICDPDDWLTKDALESLYNFTEKNTLDIAIGDKYKVYSYKKGKKYISSFPKKLHIVPNKKYTDSHQIAMFAFGEVSPHAKLYRTNITQKIKFPHKISYTDTILYVMALSEAKSVGYIDKPLAYYLMDRPGNTMTAQVKKRIEHTLEVWNSLYDQLNNVQADNDYMYFMYILLKIILSLEAQLPSKFVKNNFDTKNNNMIKLLRKKDLKILAFDDSSKINRVIFRGLMSPTWSVITMKAYIKLKRGLKK
ncbi:glycosyltransferase [Lactobacillus rodentium]|uniref:Glycosyl transferase n=1 Tax=Lactobacillus rodentium TaxID=947835 RepID=A0A2Z6TTE8_9LACO|nr:glycosyltransferase family 2 protein [Lactobacillus rodentium]MCR1894760.1 glycosyltransferase [Lactobacillus rodentium]GBG04989.1 glycosyl transferase [Lactobacillus rodentium]